MKLIKELTNKDVGLKNKKVEEYRVRKAARAVVFNKDGKVAILHASKNGYHKIAGGGIYFFLSDPDGNQIEIYKPTMN